MEMFTHSYKSFANAQAVIGMIQAIDPTVEVGYIRSDNTNKTIVCAYSKDPVALMKINEQVKTLALV